MNTAYKPWKVLHKMIVLLCIFAELFNGELTLIPFLVERVLKKAAFLNCPVNFAYELFLRKHLLGL